MIQRRSFKTKSIKMLIIDEADEMLTKGFKDQVYDIYRYLPYSTQNIVVSATLPNEVLQMTTKFMSKNTIRILVKRDELTDREKVLKEHYKNVLAELLHT